MAIVTLNELAPLQSGKIIRVKGFGPLRQRLMDMGMVPGAEIKVVRVAPLGDPIEYQVKGYHLSLRSREAQHILVDVEIYPLDQIQPGTRVRLIDVHGGRQFTQRLLAMGLKPGKLLQVLEHPADGPLRIQAGEQEYSLGQGMARRILVQPTSGEQS